MIFKSSRWTQEDIYETESNLWYIMSLIYNSNGYKPVDFYDLTWIISRANKEMFDKYCLACVNVEIFNLLDYDSDIIPNTFKPKKFTDKEWLDYISEAQKEAIKHAYNKWKWYGKWCIRLNKLLKGQK